jgi:diguanylate cyclase (GGDEF)-like protein
VDRFKEVNDTLGHLRGDDLLREIAAVINSVSRINDIPCRYAGDEFVLLLPATNREQAEDVAGRLRTSVDSIPLVDGRVKIGASVGVATFPADGDHGRELIHVADRRMYEDKFHRRRSATILTPERETVPAGR